MANDAFFAVTGYVATQPRVGKTKDGACSLSMRVAWTPRAIDKATGDWADQQTSFVSVICYRKVAEHAAQCVRRGDPVLLRGTLQVREYTDRAGARRTSVDVVADSLGHDMSRGLSHYTKVAQHAEQTAQEYEWSNAGRDPLPGDAAGRAGAQQSGVRDQDDLAGLPDAERLRAQSMAGNSAELTPDRTVEAQLASADDRGDLPDPADPDDLPDPGDPDALPDPADLASVQPVAGLADARA